MNVKNMLLAMLASVAVGALPLRAADDQSDILTESDDEAANEEIEVHWVNPHLRKTKGHKVAWLRMPGGLATVSQLKDKIATTRENPIPRHAMRVSTKHGVQLNDHDIVQGRQIVFVEEVTQ